MDDKRWHISMAKYNDKMDAVRYRRVKSFSNFDDCFAYFTAHAHKAINFYHEDAVHFDNPYLAMGESPFYTLEHKKVRMI